MGNTQSWTVSNNVQTPLQTESGKKPHGWVNKRFSIRSLRFGAFEVDLESRELRKHGIRMRLAEKPFQILELLLERDGQVVTRKSLKEKLWPDTHVGFEHSLNTAINTLRMLLGDSAQNARYIETLPRLGYRFVAPVIRPERPSQQAAKKMLAVLPIEHFGPVADQEHFADGLTEELTSQLGQLDALRLGVIARTSAIQYKATKKSIAEIARELNVGWVLEGSVRRAERHVRVTIQLIQATDETHQWSASYDRELRDVLSLQSEVARAVAKALAGVLLPASAASEMSASSTCTPKASA